MTKNKSKATTKRAYPDNKAVRFFLEDIHDRITRFLNRLPDPDVLAHAGDIPRGPGCPRPETVTGQVKGPWVVRAVVNQDCIHVIIKGGREARSGDYTYDRSVTLAGDDWRPLVTEAVTEMRRRTGLPIRIDYTQIYGVSPRINSDGDIEDSERGEIYEELADILSELADAPLPPQTP